MPHGLVRKTRVGVLRETPTSPEHLRRHRALPRSTLVFSERTMLRAEALRPRHSFTAAGQSPTFSTSPAHRMLMLLVWTLQISRLAAEPRRTLAAIRVRTSRRSESGSATRRQTSPLPTFIFMG